MCGATCPVLCVVRLAQGETTVTLPESFQHEPVLLAEVLEHLAPRPGATMLDGTVGLGGHALQIAERLAPGGRLIGLDIDQVMLASARTRLAGVREVEARLEHASYVDTPAVLDRLGVDALDGALLDLGVNSAQLDQPERGFSFDREGPLDMRFDQNQKRQAVDLVNALSEQELADIFYEFGQETQSRRVARRICEVRHSGRITTTKALAAAVESALGGEGKSHPATRVFQALRIAVNQELERLEMFCGSITPLLRKGGRLVIISFHSLEDAVVKRFLREAKQAKTFRELTKRPVIAGPEERRTNRRSRSAKLRAAERL